MGSSGARRPPAYPPWIFFSHMTTRISIDSGGTFTDCVFLRDGKLEVLKVFFTPDDPARAVLAALEQIAPGTTPVVVHGTTVGTNTVLERKGARVAFVTTEGFADTIAIGRQTRPKLYDWLQAAPECLVSPERRFGIAERTTAERAVLASPSPQQLKALVEAVKRSGAESVALSLLFAFANPQNEILVESALAELGLPVSTSHRILPEFREYERASTVAVNAYLAPRMQSYLAGLDRELKTQYPGSRVEVMQSAGGIIPASQAAREPVRTVLSGPAGGVLGAYRMAQMAGYDRIIGFDMGGTSTDVCLVDAAAGGLRISNEAVIAGIPVSVPMLDIHTVGAGGGSIARFDTGGLLRVGPESAGSDPGPICFGRGERPTVTDANLMLGRLDAERFLGGAVRLGAERTRVCMDRDKGPLVSVEQFASGIVRVVEASMEKAIRLISVQRGYDPREFTLVAFGGGGPLHAAALARALRIPRVLVPRMPGALSALGILLADKVRDYSRTVMLTSEEVVLEPYFLELEERGRHESEEAADNPLSHRSADLRYRGQAFELNVPYGAGMLPAFHQMHRRLYGFADEERPVEIVNVRVRLVSPAESVHVDEQPCTPGDGAHAIAGRRTVLFEGVPHGAGLYERELLHPGDAFPGPALVREYSSATLLHPGDHLQVDARGNLLIEVHG